MIAAETSDLLPALTDAQSVQAALTGEPLAFAKLYDRHAPLIRAICWDTAANLPDAQDLYNETFLRAYRKLGELRDPQKFAPWLIGIARFVCQEFKRGKSRDRHQFVGISFTPDEPQTSADEPDKEQIKELHSALAALSNNQRLALHLFYLQENSADASRAVLNLSRAGFYKLLDRARNELAKNLTPENRP